MYDKISSRPSASSLVGDGDDISGNAHLRACAHLPESSSTIRQTPINNASGRRSLRPKLNVKTAAIISVLVFCAVYSTLLEFHYQQMYQRLYNDRGVSSFDAPQLEEEDGQNRSLGIGAQDHQQQVQEELKRSQSSQSDGNQSKKTKSGAPDKGDGDDDEDVYFLDDWAATSQNSAKIPLATKF